MSSWGQTSLLSHNSGEAPEVPREQLSPLASSCGEADRVTRGGERKEQVGRGLSHVGRRVNEKDMSPVAEA